ncbi:MAG: ABC transporter ATP-binding protein [Anaerolineales bacterium]
MEIRFDGASFSYGRRIILRDLAFSVRGGEILGVVGPNGVGKSTLIRGASGVLAPYSGRVFVDGQDLETLPPRKRAQIVAVVPQAVQLPETFLAQDVVLMGRTAHLGWLGQESESDRRIAQAAMRQTGTLAFAERQVGELSGGEQQRVLIARALAQESGVLLLDEPTAHLDLKHQDDVLHLIRSLSDENGLAVILTLHDLNLVARFTDRVALLSDGMIRKIGSARDVLTPEELAAAYGIAIHVTDHPIHGTPLILS